MAATRATAAPYAATRTPLNSNQIKGFWAAWGGWCLDGMDAFIYSLVLVPALTELLPKSGLVRALSSGGLGVAWSLFIRKGLRDAIHKVFQEGLQKQGL